MASNVPVFLTESDIEKKENFYIPWPATGRPIEDGIHDVWFWEELIDIDYMGRNGKFASRLDQTTIVRPLTEKVEVEYLADGSKHSITVPAGKIVGVPPAIEFTIHYSATAKVQVLNRTTEAIGRVICSNNIGNRLNASFAVNPISIVDASTTGATLCHGREGYRTLDQDNKGINTVTTTPYPGNTFKHTKVGVLENGFTMEWQTIDGIQQVHFEGTNGVLSGKSGEPGVFLENEKEIQVNLLLKRADGTFYLEANNDFLMIVGTSLGNGDPDQKTLKIAKFPKTGVKLAFGYWHSVPIPIPGDGKLILVELVSDTNANCTIDVNEETGHKIRALI